MTLAGTDEEQELMRLQKLVLEASDKGDKPTLERHLADDFVLTYSFAESGAYGFLNKAQAIAKWGTQNPAAEATLVSEQQVHISGDTAIIFALIKDRFRDKSGVRVIQTWASDVWVKRNGEWRWFAAHETILKES